MALKLYDVTTSPYCARVRYFIAASSLPVEIVKADYRDPEYKKINPIGKVPALELPTGQYAGSNAKPPFGRLAESEVIIEYLADVFRPPVYRAIQPTDPVTRARSRFVSRIVDLYIGPHTMVLYIRMPEAAQKEAVQQIEKYLALLNDLVPSPLFTGERRPVAGDVALGMLLVHIELLGKRVELTPLDKLQNLRTFYQAMLQDPDFAKLRQETDTAFAERRAAAAASKARESKTANKL